MDSDGLMHAAPLFDQPRFSHEILDKLQHTTLSHLGETRGAMVCIGDG